MTYTFTRVKNCFIFHTQARFRVASPNVLNMCYLTEREYLLCLPKRTRRCMMPWRFHDAPCHESAMTRARHGAFMRMPWRFHDAPLSYLGVPANTPTPADLFMQSVVKRDAAMGWHRLCSSVQAPDNCCSSERGSRARWGLASPLRCFCSAFTVAQKDRAPDLCHLFLRQRRASSANQRRILHCYYTL